MSLFSKQLYTPVVENAETPEVVEVTESMLYDAMMECSETITKVISALYITDAIMESQSAVLEADGDEEKKKVDVKAALKSAKDRVVGGFKKLWDTIKNWFTTAIDKLKVMFTSRKKFYDKYGNDIAAKAKTMKKLVLPKFYVYDLKAVDKFTAWAGMIKDEVAKIVAGAGKEKMGKSEIRKELIATVAGKEGFNTSEIADVTDFKRAAERKLRKLNENFTVNPGDVTNLLEIGKASKGDMETVQKLFKITSDEFTKAIKAVNGAEDGDELETASKTFNAGIAVIQSFSSWAVSFIAQRSNYAYSFLKNFATSTKFGEVVKGPVKATEAAEEVEDAKEDEEKKDDEEIETESVDSIFESVLASL